MSWLPVLCGDTNKLPGEGQAPTSTQTGPENNKRKFILIHPVAFMNYGLPFWYNERP